MQSHHVKSGERVLLTTGDMAALLQTSTRTIWRLLAAGKLPKPLQVGARPRLLVREIGAWIDAGMPSVDSSRPTTSSGGASDAAA